MKKKKYKTLAGMKRALKHQYNQGVRFESEHKATQEFLEKLGVTACCGIGGAIVGSCFGPQGALIGGILGCIAGLMIIGVIKIKKIDLTPGKLSITFI